MNLNLVRFEVHLRIEYHKLLIETFSVRTKEMILAKMNLQGVIVDVVLLLPATFSAIANVTALVFVSAVCIQLIVSVEALTAEAAFRVALETTLVYGAGIVVAKLLMLSEFRKCE